MELIVVLAGATGAACSMVAGVVALLREVAKRK